MNSQACRAQFLATLLILFVLLGALIPAQSGQAALPQPVYRNGELLVKFKAGATEKIAQTHANARAARMLRAGQLEHVRLSAGMDVEGMRRWYQRQPNVEYAEPNYIVHKSAAPNDTHFELQWGLRNTGQRVNGTFGLAGADIRASAAWDRHTGNGSVVVAVVDSGIDYNHPDLAANVWANPGEIQGDGIDNDANGKIDDVRGWNFANNNADPLDDDEEGGHGSHVAGIIGAVGNNANGVSGVNWNVKLMPLKVLSADGVGDLANIVAAIDYAIAKGAAVINASYAFDCGVAPSQSERDALNRARLAGILLTLPAGNEGCDNDKTPTYPASHALNNILSVGASDQFDVRAVFARPSFLGSSSNYGAHSVHLFAPGKNIYGTLRSADYGFESGTSMSAPHVAGAAALLKSYRPALSMFEVREILLKTAQAKTALAGLAVTGGRLDAGLAMDFDLAASSPIQPSHVVASKINDSRIELSWLDDSTIESGWKLEYRNDPGTSFTSRANLSSSVLGYDDTAAQAGEGTYNGYRVRAYNGVGDSAPSAEVKIVTPPLAPDNLRVTDQGGTVTIAWTDRSARETGYRLDRASAGGFFNEIANLPANATQYADNGLTLGTEYQYRARAYSVIAGFSDYSATVVVTPGESSGGTRVGCFIATAAYGSALHPKVNALRQFRDSYLLPNLLGRIFVSAYYRISPPLADFIAHHDWLRASVRVLLWPLAWFAEAVVPDVAAGSFNQPVKMESDATVNAEHLTERQLLVKFNPAVSEETARANLAEQGGIRVKPLSGQLFQVEFSNQAQRQQAQAKLSTSRQVEYVEINRVIRQPNK